MLEDKLSRDERIRLECLAQANATFAGMPTSTLSVVQKAKDFERYIRDEGDQSGESK